IALTLILFISLSFALTNSIKLTEKNTTKTTTEEKSWPRYLCTGENNTVGPYTFYNGNPLTEENTTCNSQVRMYYPGDHNLFMNPYIFFGYALYNPYYPDLTFPPAERQGDYVETTFNWNKDTNYCFTEIYTSRHKTGTTDGEPTYFNGEDNSYIETRLYVDSVPGSVYEYHIPIENINKPITNIQTDRTEYTLPEGQNILPITITITDPDLECGNANWPLKAAVPLSFRNERSAETFEIRINDQIIPSTDVNYTENENWNYTGPAGSFGIYLTGPNTGEITIQYDTNTLPPGDHNLTITVYDTDGYLTMNGNYIADTFTVENYGTPQTKTIQVTKEGGVCGDADASSAVDIDDVVYLIAYIFSGGPEPVPYWTGDADGSTAIDIDDVVYLISYIFSGGPAPVC
ncbi:hypothetical protein KKB11_02195, partial [Candidatus Micrarchaeota archaeon]|nr:hypothetical protein [Candidatus Micrarchaeota archaeon]